MSTLLHYNVSLTWPDPVLDFYPLELWSPQAHTTSSGTWSSAQNSGSGTLSGVYLAHFNASSVAVTGTSQWSNMRYNASLTPDGPADNVVVQDVGEDITYGFHSGNVLFEQGDLSDELKVLDLNEGPDMQNTTYDAWSNILDVELVILTIDIPAQSEDQVVVNQTLTLSDFNYSDDKWDLVNETLTPTSSSSSSSSADPAELNISFSGTNFFLVSGWAQEAGFTPLRATLDGVTQPTQGRSHGRQAWEDGVLLFFSGLEDTNHTLTVQADPPTAIKYGLVFKAGESEDEDASRPSNHLSSAVSLAVGPGHFVLGLLVAVLAPFMLSSFV